MLFCGDSFVEVGRRGTVSRGVLESAVQRPAETMLLALVIAAKCLRCGRYRTWRNSGEARTGS